MKKIILCSVLSIIALLYSCNKDIEIESGYQVNVTVNPSNVMGVFSGIDYEMPEDCVLRINLYVYDSEGYLIEELHGKCYDYTKKVDFSVKLPVGEYTFVSTSDMYDTSGSWGDNGEFWHFSNVDYIYDFTIEDTGYLGFDNKTLGVMISKESIDYPKNILISLEAATALIRYSYKDLHYELDDIFEFVGLEGQYYQIYQYDLLIDKNVEKVVIERNKFVYPVYSTSRFVSRGDYPWYYSQNMYGYEAVLPMNNVSFWLQATFNNIEDDTMVVDPEWIHPVLLKSIKSGMLYDVEIDLMNKDIEIELAAEDKMDSDISTMKSKNTEMKLMDLVDSNPNLKVDRSNLSK